MRKILVWCLAIVSLFLTSCTRTSKGDSDRLNVLCYSFETNDITNAYLIARDPYQSFKVPRFITPNEDFSNMDELYDSLMTGFIKKSPDIDLFLIDSRDPHACQIIENQYYTDLSQDESVMAYFDDMFPEIVDWCSDGDAVFGFPFHVFYNMQIMADEEKIRSVGYTLEDIAAVEGLQDFCDTWRTQRSSPSYDGHYRSAIEYCKNYMLLHFDRDTGELDLDAPEFRNLISQCRELNETQPFFQEPYGSGNVITDVSPLYFGFSALIPQQNQQCGQYAPIPYPLLAGEPPDTKRYATVYWMMINPYSEHKDWAMRCIEGLAKSSGGNHLSISPIYRDAEYYKEDGPVPSTFTQEMLDKAAPILQRTFVGISFPGYRETVKILDAYVTDGAKTMDEAIEEAQNILDLMRAEQYIGR